MGPRQKPMETWPERLPRAFDLVEAEKEVNVPEFQIGRDDTGVFCSDGSDGSDVLSMVTSGVPQALGSGGIDRLSVVMSHLRRGANPQAIKIVR